MSEADEAYDRIMARYQRVTFLTWRYMRRPWDLPAAWRSIREMSSLLRAMVADLKVTEGEN